MKAKYLVMIALLAATFAACSRDEESLFDKSAAERAREAVENAFDVFTSAENGWEMAYFPNLEADSKGYNMFVKFNKNGNVSVTAKNDETTGGKILTDTASTWVVRSDYGPLLSFDTYNDVFHAWADPRGDGAGMLGDYEFLILKATPEVVILKGKKHSAYSVMRPVKSNTSVEDYFATAEKMMSKLFGNGNIVTLNQDGQKKYLYYGSTGQFQSAEYGEAFVPETATYHPVCATEDGIIVCTGFGEDVHEHIFTYDSIKGELVGEAGTVLNAGNLNLLYRSYFSDNANGWAVDPTDLASANQLLEAINTLMKNTSAKFKNIGYGYKQSLNMYEGGYFINVTCSYKQGKSNKETKLNWTVDITMDENGITIANAVPFDTNTETWIKNIPVLQDLANDLMGEFTATPNPANLFNAAAGMNLVGTSTLPIKGVSNMKM